MLSPTRCKTAKPGVHGDGRGSRGLALRVYRMSNGRVSRRWRQRIRIGGKLTTIALGSFPEIGLARARELALQNAGLAAEGLDPRHHQSEIPSFAEAAETVVRLHEPTWTNPALAVAWRQSFKDYCGPILSLRIDRVTSAHMMVVLLPIWLKRPAAARSVRQRIGAVCKWAIAQGYRADDPAGDAVLAALPRQPKGGNFRSMPHGELGEALRLVRESETGPVVKAAIEFTALTAVRISEAVEADWTEFDLEAGLWTIPASRVKTKTELRVPLAPESLEVLRRLEPRARGPVFQRRQGKAISRQAAGKVLRKLGVRTTLHGFRSCFRSWAAEQGADRQVAELCLGHKVGGIEGVYQRSDLLDQRRVIMAAWSAYLG